MKLKKRQFEIDDAKMIIHKSVEPVDCNITDDMLIALKNSGEAKTWFYENEIVGCGGVVLYEKGKCEVWDILNKDTIGKFKIELVKSARSFLDKMAKKYNITYMRAVKRIDFNNKWLEHLGFTQTNELAMDGTAYVYARSF